jgi:2,4-dienoyl-CoA reductase-like NADH-dependent reductase (Old Yellow Enzyme family)
LIMMEATGVEPHGRISAQCLGLWNDGQAEAMSRIVSFLVEQGAVPAIQLAHAGRKSTVPGSIGPSAVAFSSDYAVPHALTVEEIDGVVRAFRDAAVCALDAGFLVAEVHSAHGYLLHEFLSPLSNRRDDAYGGSFENRVRLDLEVVRAVRAVWPERLPVFVRISATDWAPGGWDAEQSVALACLLVQEGVDLVDVSSGGVVPGEEIPVAPGYQVPFAERIRHEAGIATAAVGRISDARHADGIVREGRADAVFMGLQSLRDPYWPMRASRELGHDMSPPVPYARAW